MVRAMLCVSWLSADFVGPSLRGSASSRRPSAARRCFVAHTPVDAGVVRPPASRAQVAGRQGRCLRRRQLCRGDQRTAIGLDHAASDARHTCASTMPACSARRSGDPWPRAALQSRACAAAQGAMHRTPSVRMVVVLARASAGRVARRSLWRGGTAPRTEKFGTQPARVRSDRRARRRHSNGPSRSSPTRDHDVRPARPGGRSSARRPEWLARPKHAHPRAPIGSARRPVGRRSPAGAIGGNGCRSAISEPSWARSRSIRSATFGGWLAQGHHQLDEEREGEVGAAIRNTPREPLRLEAADAGPGRGAGSEDRLRLVVHGERKRVGLMWRARFGAADRPAAGAAGTSAWLRRTACGRAPRRARHVAVPPSGRRTRPAG